MPIFSNLYVRIQNLANQNFTYKQLAQMKYILPEAITVKKVLLRDDSTCRMKPDLQINMNAESIGINMKEEGQNAYLHLRKVFRQRLVEFVKSKPAAKPKAKGGYKLSKFNFISNSPNISYNFKPNPYSQLKFQRTNHAPGVSFFFSFLSKEFKRVSNYC
jgi:DNA replication factor CDT1 like